MLSYIKRIPLLRLLLPFIGGLIGCAFLIELVPIKVGLVWWVLAALALVIILMIVFKRASFSQRWGFGALVNLAFVAIGGLSILINSPELYPNSLVHDDGNEKVWLIEIEEEPVEKVRSVKLIVHAIRVDSSNVSGKAFIYLEKTEAAKTLQNGDKLLIKASLNPISTPGNPHEFNYPRYLRFHGVFRQAYLTTEHWLWVGGRDGFDLLASIAGFRMVLLNRLDSSIFSVQERAIVAALTLGYKEELDPETTRAFSGAGAMHVLAVSGLHVGILYAMIMGMFTFLTRIKNGDMIRAILVITLLISYAMLTGMSASVFRASTMFSFVAWAKASKRYSNIYNTLTASAFVLLLLDPYLIMQVGFQLSYAAVIGIVFLHPKLFSLLVIKNRMLDSLWNITCVSLAAQIATFPLGLLYFHQFPNYFLFSNWVVIPLATFIMYAGMGLFTLGWIPFLTMPLCMILKWLALGLNEFVNLVRELPFSMLQGIDISAVETVLIYCVIASFALLTANRNFKFTYLMLGSISVLFFLQISETISQEQQQNLLVYNVRKGFALDLVSGKDHLFVADERIVKDKNSMLFHVEHNWWAMGLGPYKRLDSISMGHQNTGVLFEINQNLVWLPPSIIDSIPSIAVDLLVIRDSEGTDWGSVLSTICVNQIVIGQNLGYLDVKKIRGLCEQKDIRLHDCRQSGPFIF